MGDAELTELTEQARRGDTGAAAQLIAAHLPYWMAAARQIIAVDQRTAHASGAREEAGDLVQAATLKLLEQWREGAGPTSNVRAYVTATMRNSYSNRLRSPRANEQSFEEIEHAFSAAEEASLADVAREMDIMRRALRGLAPDHRDVLMAVTVDGVKPGELTEQFGRQAPAISNLLARAKHALFRAVLIEHLSDGGSECAANAGELPNRVHADLDEHPGSAAGLSHVRGCERCRTNWRRFATIMSAFGLLPLLTVTQLTVGGAPASAAPGETDEPDADVTNTDETNTDEPDEAGGHGADDATAGTGSAPVSTPAAPLAAGASGAAGGVSRVAWVLSSKLALGLGAASLAVAVLALGGHAVLGQREGETVTYAGDFVADGDHGASFDVALDTDQAGSLQTVRASFAATEAEDWSMGHVALRLSPGTEFRSASHGLECTTTGEFTLCHPAPDSAPRGTYVFEVADAEPGGSLSLELAVEADGDEGTGRATGKW